MPRIYTVQQKKHALYLLRELDDDAVVVSRILHIPERTLRDWAFRHRIGGDYILPSRDPSLVYQGKSGTLSPAEIRDRLLEQVEKLTRSSGDDPRKVYFTSLAMNHLLNQIKSLNEVIGIQPPPDFPEESPLPETDTPSGTAGNTGSASTKKRQQTAGE